MATVTTLASHLLNLLQPPTPASAGVAVTVPKVDAARLAFYHFLKNLCEPGEPLTSATLDRFFRRALTHHHWVENKTTLFEEVANTLQHFSNQNNEAVPMLPFSTANEIQVISAESFKSLERVVEDWILSHQRPTDQIKVLRDRDEKLIVCRLMIDRTLSVHLFDRSLSLRDGRLEPLTDDMVIHYTSELAIDSNLTSQIEIAPYTVARFRNGSTGIHGLAARGFSFQKMGSFEGGDLHRHATLFYPLKRIEQFFVHRNTDPMYIELTGLLEKASDLLAHKHSEAVRFAEAALERGKLAFEQVFVDDRMLRLLLENLEQGLQLERRTLLPVELSAQLSDNAASGVDLGIGLGVRLTPGEEFIEPFGPDLVELQEAESCEIIAPINAVPVHEAANKAPRANPSRRLPLN